MELFVARPATPFVEFHSLPSPLALEVIFQLYNDLPLFTVAIKSVSLPQESGLAADTSKLKCGTSVTSQDP